MRKIFILALIIGLSAPALADPQAIKKFRIDAYHVYPGQGAYLYWYVEGASSVKIEPGLGLVSPGECG